MKILVFTEKPFAPAAVKAIADVINASGNDMELVERGTRADLLNAVKAVSYTHLTLPTIHG